MTDQYNNMQEEDDDAKLRPLAEYKMIKHPLINSEQLENNAKEQRYIDVNLNDKALVYINQNWDTCKTWQLMPSVFNTAPYFWTYLHKHWSELVSLGHLSNAHLLSTMCSHYDEIYDLIEQHYGVDWYKDTINFNKEFWQRLAINNYKAFMEYYTTNRNRLLPYDIFEIVLHTLVINVTNIYTITGYNVTEIKKQFVEFLLTHWEDFRNVFLHSQYEKPFWNSLWQFKYIHLIIDDETRFDFLIKKSGQTLEDIFKALCANTTAISTLTKYIDHPKYQHIINATNCVGLQVLNMIWNWPNYNQNFQHPKDLWNDINTINNDGLLFDLIYKHIDCVKSMYGAVANISSNKNTTDLILFVFKYYKLKSDNPLIYSSFIYFNLDNYTKLIDEQWDWLQQTGFDLYDTLIFRSVAAYYTVYITSIEVLRLYNKYWKCSGGYYHLLKAKHNIAVSEFHDDYCRVSINISLDKLTTEAINIIERFWYDTDEIEIDIDLQFDLLDECGPEFAVFIDKYYDWARTHLYQFSHSMASIALQCTSNIEIQFVEKHWNDIISNGNHMLFRNPALIDVIARNFDSIIPKYYITLLRNPSPKILDLIVTHWDKLGEPFMTLMPTLLLNNPVYLIDTYQVAVKKYFHCHVTAELMSVMFHPKNIKRFADWGIESGYCA